jgi:hypothetical protein
MLVERERKAELLQVRRLILIARSLAWWRKNPVQHTPNLQQKEHDKKRRIQDADSLGLLTDLDSGDDMVRLFSTISGITCEHPVVSMARRTKICVF